MREQFKDRMRRAVVDAYWHRYGEWRNSAEMLEAITEAAVQVAENEQHGRVVARPVE
jgi:hypothetical protein